MEREASNETNVKSKNRRVTTKPHKTLQQEFPSPKFRPPIDLQTNVFIRSLATTARGTTSVKRGDVFQPEKKNISGMSRAALKDPTSQIMLGRTIIQLTLRMQLSLTKATIACEKLLNRGILQ